ncbi:hypothetical protein BJV82DRAFT_110362 [Fennellomyces sp. T-0311]|nr:hypothetical protein BJV82DRAFT_110362 [Fennellomyces sp. T-0311]
MLVGHVRGSVTCWTVDFGSFHLHPFFTSCAFIAWSNQSNFTFLAYTQRMSRKSETFVASLSRRVHAENNSTPSKIVPQPPSNCSLRLNVTPLNAVCPFLYHSRRISQMGLLSLFRFKGRSSSSSELSPHCAPLLPLTSPSVLRVAPLVTTPPLVLLCLVDLLVLGLLLVTRFC